MRNQSPIRWGICLALLVAAAVVWRQSRPASRPADATAQSPAGVTAQMAKPVNVGPLLSVPSTLRNFGAEVAAVPPDARFPNRLRNTEASMDELVKNDRALLLANALIDTGVKTKLAIPEHLKAKEDPGSYIVQSRGTINESFQSQLRSVGAEVIAYIPNNAYLVRVDAGGASKLARMPWTRSVLPYEPYYKVQDRLLQLAVKQGPIPMAAHLRLTFFPGELPTAREKVEKLGAVVLGEDRSPFGPQLIIKPNKDSLVALAALPEVQTIEQQGKRVTMTDLTRVTVGVATNSITTNNFRDLVGSNIWVSVNDYSVDVNYPGLSGRVVVGPSTAVTDTSGHGTHVATILAGSGDPAPTFTTNFMGSSPSNNFRGMAPSAKLYVQNFQAISDAALSENAATYNLTVNLKTNTLISNNSWGYEDTFDYDSSSAIYDAATRDAIPGISGSQPVLFVFSAGNDGFGSDNGLGGLPGSLTAPAAAKNVIAVGASEQLRYITNEVTIVDLAGNTNIVPWWEGTTDSSNQVAGYSGRGNTGLGREGQYGRFKPEVVAPGSMTIAGRSTTWDTTNYYNPTRLITTAFTNVIIPAGQTFNFSMFVPDFSINYSVQVLDSASQLAVPNIAIFTSQTDVPPSGVPGNYDGTTPYSYAVATTEYGIWFYDLVNSNATDVVVDIIETITLTNNLGNLYQVLSNDLNEPLGPDYRFEVGTSMAAPVVSGMLALMQEFFERELGEMSNSPALYKAMLINSARSISETYGFETRNILNHQGWGLANLTNAIPEAMDPAVNPRTSWPVQYFDQHPTNALATGQTHTRLLTMSPAGRPFPLRVTLVWTDPPGNPAASLKLVNDLDLVLTNLDTGEVFFGNDFASGSIFSTGTLTSTNATSDLVNNVENIYLPGDMGTNFAIAVVAKRVNVNAVTAHTNGIVQDYALVVSSGNTLLTDAFTLEQSPTLTQTNLPTVRYFTSATNSLPFMAQRVGANPPLITTTNGTNVQWNFYVFTNDSGLPYVTFVSFLPPNLSGDPRHNTYRDPSADIDMYVSLSSDLTNLNSSVINDAFLNQLTASSGPYPATAGAVSTNRTGTEALIVNSAANQVYYVGIKSEDQKGAEFGFMAVASLRPPFEKDGDNHYTVRFLPLLANIPDGTPELPGGVQVFGIVPQSLQIRRVVVTNQVTHELFGDLVGTLEHNGVFATLNNHTFVTSTNQGGTVTVIYDDSDQADISGSRESDGPGTMNSFVGQDAAGAWVFTMIDNAPQFVGSIDELVMGIDAQPDQDADGGAIDAIYGLQPGRSFYGAINVPVGVVRMKITLRGLSGPTFTGLYLKKDSLPNGLAGNYDHGKEANTDYELTISTADVPPLTPGRYYLQVLNLDSFAADYELDFEFFYDLSATVQTTGTQRSVLTMVDDALNAGNQAQINVTSPGDVAGVRVGVRIAHPRTSDLVLRLSNGERSVVLAENRGGTINTNGYGFGTNLNEIIYTHFGENTDTATQLMKFVNPLVDANFVHFVTPRQLAVNYLEDRTSQMITNVAGGRGAPGGRLVDTAQTAGQIRIRYMFYTDVDDLDIYDSANNPISVGVVVGENNVRIDIDPADVDAATDTFTSPAHTYADGDEISFLAGGFFGDVLPAGIVERVRYYAVNTTANTFQVSLTPGGAAVDILDAGIGTHRSYEWEIYGPINYTSADGILYLTVNQGSADPTTLWDYVIELFDTGGVPFTPPVLSQTEQIARRVAFSGTNLYVVGSTEANVKNGIYARFGLPMQTGQIPFESANWPFNAGGTRFHDVAYSYNNNVYVAGDSYTRSSDAVGSKENKGIAVRFPNVGLANLGDKLGSLWDVNIAGVAGVEGLEEMHAVISSMEGGSPGTEYVYLAGNAADAASSSRLKVAKLDTTGATVLPAFEDVTGAATVSAGRALAVLTNVTLAANFIYVAGFSDDDGTMRPVIFKFDESLTEIDRQALPTVGQFYGLAAYDGYLYAVGVQDALSGAGANFLIVKYDANLNVVWSSVGDTAYDLGGEDIFYGLAVAGDRIYAVGSSVNGGSGVDGVLLEILTEDGSLVTRVTPPYTGVTYFDGGANGTDSFRDVTMDGTDLYVVGEATQLGQTHKDAVILRYHVKDDYLPEESLDNFVGDVAAGVWRLEVLDARTNYTGSGSFVPRIIDWQLQLFLADTNVTTFRLDNAVDHIGTIQGGQIHYFVINAPMTASSATHTLTVNSGAGLGLGLFHDPSTRPNVVTSSQLLNAITTTGTRVVDLTSSPQLVPGQRYFLAVTNNSPNTISTEYVLNVTFDSTATTYLAGGAMQQSSFSDLPNPNHAYQFLIPPADNFAAFELLNLTGDVEVRLNRGRPPTETDYDLAASFTGTNFGRVVIEPTGGMPDVSGFWYALVKSLSGPSTSYTVLIRPLNKPPVVSLPDGLFVEEGSLLELFVPASDSDLPAGQLTYSFSTEAPAGMTIDPVTGLISWAPGENQGPASYAVTVRVTDDGFPVRYTDKILQVTVGEVNSAPVLPALNLAASEGVLFAPVVGATDADLPANVLSYSLVSAPEGMFIDAGTGQINWTPGETAGGQTAAFTVRVTDNKTPELTATRDYTVFVQESNTAPVFGQIAAQTITELVPYTLSSLVATDADVPANSLTYRFVGSVPAGLQIDGGTGRIIWTPTEAQGPATYEITVEAVDSGSPALTAQKTFSITVQEANTAPFMTPINAQTAAEVQAWSYQVQVTDADLPANTLTYSLPTAPAGMTVTAGGMLQWTPTEAQGPGTYAVTVLVRDDASPALGASRSFNITVTEANAAPSLNAIADVAVDEQTSLVLQAVASDSDVPAQTLTYKFPGTVPAGLTIGASSGTINWSPSEAQGPASYPVTVEVSDGTATASRSFTITVNEVNLAPTLGVIPNVTVTEGQAVRLVAVGNDADNPGQTLTYSLEAGAASGAQIDPNTGAFEWLTAEGSPNSNSLTITVTDNGVPPLSASRTFTITVNEVVTNVVDLVSGVAVTNTTRYADGIVADIYRLNVTGQPGKLLFEAFNLNGNGDLLVRRGAYPTPTLYDHRSNLSETNREQVVVTTNETVVDLSGEWFATVINRETTNITYSISGTVPVAVAGGAMLVSTEGIMVEAPILNPGDGTPEFSWTAVQGEKYQVEVSTDLVNWTPLTNIVVTGATATFTDPTPYTDSALRFYRIRQVPQ
jgi:subtilisin-like proprotein convertase family protein